MAEGGQVAPPRQNEAVKALGRREILALMSRLARGSVHVSSSAAMRHDRKRQSNFLDQSIRFLCVRDYELTDFTRVVIMVEDAS